MEIICVTSIGKM